MKHASLLTLALLAAASGTALADDNWYAVGEISHSKTHLDTSVSDAAMGDANSSVTGDSGTQWRLQVGYQFTPNFALEAGYIDFGKADFKATGGSLSGTAHGTVKAGGVDLAALGILPVTENLSLFGKAGVVAAKVRSTVDADPPGDSSANVVAPLLGVGLTYKVADNLDLRAEYDHVSGLGKSHTTDKLSSSMVSAGVVYHF